MNKKAQLFEEIHPVALIMGILGGLLGVYMANSMGAGLLMKLVILAVVGVVCFAVSNVIFTKQ
jgi:hypothetical protein